MIDLYAGNGAYDEVVLAWNANRCPQFDDTGFDHHAHDDGISRLEDMLRQNTQFAREDGDVFELLSLPLAKLLSGKRNQKLR